MSKILSFLIIIFLINIDILSEEIGTKVNKGSDSWVQETKSYINNFRNLRGNFTQIDYVGNISKGFFWINDKGEIAFHYKAPSEVIIIYKNGKIFFKEKKKDKFRNFPVTNNPILGLIEEESNIEDYLTSAIIDNNIGKIFISSNKNNNRNSLEVIFDYPKPILRQWKIIDHQRKETNVFFSKITYENKIGDQYFITK